MRPRLALTAAILLASPCARLHAQGTWDAILTVDPYPTPYYSDWDANPDIATLTLINSTMDAQQIRIHFNVINHANRIVVSGSSEPQLVAAGATVIFDNPYDVAGSTTHDTDMEEVAARTGRMPEGDYTACAVAVDGSGFVLAESCAPFSIVYPDPPLLLSPMDAEAIDQPDPLFTWTPVQVPIDYQVSYVVRVVEVLENQNPAEALRENIPHYEMLEGQLTSLRYPIDAQPLEAGKTYAWSVQALDQNGYTAAANDGRSEIWTFRYDDGTGLPTDGRGTRVALTLDAETDLSDDSEESTTNGLLRICSTWDSPERFEGIDFPIMSGFVFPVRITLPTALLVRDVLPDGSRAWAVTGATSGHVAMLSGTCAGAVTVPRWVGIRTADDTQELTQWLLTDAVPGDTETGAKLEFGVAILSLFEEEVGGDALDVVRAFLENHEFEVRPGLNVFGAIDAREIPWLWSLLDGAYDDDEHELELQGFVGVNRSYALRLGAHGRFTNRTEENPGFEPQGEVSIQTERLVLRAALPKKTFDGAGIKSMQWGLELSVGDSISLGAGRDVRAMSTDIIPKIFVDIVDGRDIAWTGTLELVIGLDWKEMTRKGRVQRPDFKGTLRLVSDHEWQPGILDGSDIALGHWEVFLDLNELHFPLSAGLDIDLNGRASLIAFGEDVATVHVTLGRHGGQSHAELAQESYARDSTYVAAGEALVEEAQARLRRATERNDTAGARIARQDLERREADLEVSRALARSSQSRRSMQQSAAAALERRNRPAPRADGSFFWEASVAFGNMSIVDFLALLGNIVEAQREDP